MTSDLFLLPEWHSQEAIILAWPDQQTDWAPWLTEVQQTYLDLIHNINQADCAVLLLIRCSQLEQFKQIASKAFNVVLIIADYNDTWVRDYGFLTCQSAHGLQPVEYQFNGWGNKFDASKDNQINTQVLASLCKHSLTSYPLVCEGGALEIDQNHHLLSTSQCLLNPQRNGKLSEQQYKSMFSAQLGANQVTILQNGHLEGDDTDGHVDTLVRFTPSQGLVIQSCYNRPNDTHFEGLSALVDECCQVFPEHQIFELPLPNIVNQDSVRLPASYANFLICNDSVLCPIYQQPEDQEALNMLASAYPKHRIVPINALPLIQQFGSIHCISMQVPTGTLKPEVLAHSTDGLSLYE
jgi:agmatine/peptidylarginine deiminase